MVDKTSFALILSAGAVKYLGTGGSQGIPAIELLKPKFPGVRAQLPAGGETDSRAVYRGRKLDAKILYLLIIKIEV